MNESDQLCYSAKTGANVVRAVELLIDRYAMYHDWPTVSFAVASFSPQKQTCTLQ